MKQIQFLMLSLILGFWSPVSAQPEDESEKASEQAAKDAMEGSIVQAGVSFKKPKNRATVKSPFEVVMDVRGMRVLPAGELIVGTGHFHIIINGNAIKEGEMIPMDQP